MAYEALPLRLDDHRDALAALWRENMSDPRIADVLRERMRWLYERNPDGPALTWVAVASGSEKLIGCGSLLRRQVLVNGRTSSAGLLADFAVAKNHRIAGAAIAIQRAVAKGSSHAGVQFLFGYPNAKSVAIFRRLGYRAVGVSSRWVKPLRSASKIQRHTKSRVLVHTASAVVDTGLAIADHARSLFRARSYDAVDLEQADARFDDLWQRARTKQVGSPGTELEFAL